MFLFYKTADESWRSVVQIGLYTMRTNSYYVSHFLQKKSIKKKKKKKFYCI